MGAIGGDELMRWERMEGPEEAVGKEEKILVSVRLRPLNAKEIARNDPSDWECINDTTIIFRNSLRERSMLPTAHTFDRVFRCECTTKEVYEEGAKEVALSVVSGINSTIFAYGQTSSGKTYTINGITEYTVADIYEYIKRHEERAFILKLSAMEIYNEVVKDLLSTESIPLRLLDDPERGTIVEKLTEETLRDWNHLKALLSVCEGGKRSSQRQIGETLLNETSSRSHQILRLTVESSAREFLGRDNSSTLVACVNFVDLAGSERASLTISSATRLKEGCHINRSLLTLGTVIRKLSKGRNGHIPYRDSKLTRILQPSLGGNARTAIICTICPARSHVEQSKNTLLFASCAKEVVTSARVNVVMSDKALVKQLQKEVARLECELRYPGSASNTSHFEMLLREKDAQIKKMEKEIKELTHERDLAHSRLEDFLQREGGDCASSQWEEASQISLSNVPNACKDILQTSKSSVVPYHDRNLAPRNFHTSVGGNNNTERYQQHSETPTKQDVPSPRHSISSSVHQSEEEIAQDTCEDNEDLCKEVQCIEMNEPVRSEDSEFLVTGGSENLSRLNENSTNHVDHERIPGQRDARPPTFLTLEQHLQNVRTTIDNLVKPYPNESSPWSSLRDFSSSKYSTITRSRSCRENLMNSSSPWFREAEQNDCTPPSSSHRDFPGRPKAFRRRLFALNYDLENEMPSGEGSEAFEQSTSNSLYKEENAKSASKEDVASISDFVAELKELAQVHYQKQLTDGQEVDRNANEDLVTEGTAKDVGLDPIVTPIGSPSRWPMEFEKKQQAIIELWHACNVSLVHRTYFFLLFKGDPTDSIYMEVELRRLSFLKRSFSRGNHSKAITGDVQNLTLIASLKSLRRERGMLCRKMRKKMTVEERESVYTKWGVALDSKQRRLQVARRLWTETKDTEHVRESASIVAKLIGLIEPGRALKEMFGLSFVPQELNRRSYSWKHGISALN